MKQIVKDYIYLLTGSVFVASAFSLFLLPNNLASGGVSGISIITYELFNISPGAFQLVSNVLLLLVGWMILGLGFGVKSLVGSIFLPGVILFYEAIDAGAAVNDTLLAAVFGGAGVGIGLGLIFRGRASTGGWICSRRFYINSPTSRSTSVSPSSTGRSSSLPLSRSRSRRGYMHSSPCSSRSR